MSALLSNSKKSTCPYCGSTLINTEIQGINYKKGLMSAAVLGPHGFVAAYLGAVVVHTCLSCGRIF